MGRYSPASIDADIMVEKLALGAAIVSASCGGECGPNGICATRVRSAVS